MKLSIKMGTCELSMDGPFADSGIAEILNEFKVRCDQTIALENAKIEAEKSRDALSLQLADKYARDQAKPDPFDALRIEVCRTAVVYVANASKDTFETFKAAVQALVNEQGIVLPAEGE